MAYPSQLLILQLLIVHGNQYIVSKKEQNMSSKETYSLTEPIKIYLWGKNTTLSGSQTNWTKEFCCGGEKVNEWKLSTEHLLYDFFLKLWHWLLSFF